MCLKIAASVAKLFKNNFTQFTVWYVKFRSFLEFHLPVISKVERQVETEEDLTHHFEQPILLAHILDFGLDGLTHCCGLTDLWKETQKPLGGTKDRNCTTSLLPIREPWTQHVSCQIYIILICNSTWFCAWFRLSAQLIFIDK